MRSALFTSLLMSIAMVACREPNGSKDSGDTSATDASSRAAISAANAKAIAAFNSGDRANFTASFGERATLMKIGAPDLVGRAALDSQFTAEMVALRASGRTAKWIADTIEVHGDYAYEVGHGIGVLPSKGPGLKPDTGFSRYITFWHKDADGVWRVSRDFTVVVPKVARKAT
jgi:ketosteroid isomerase-like protein